MSELYIQQDLFNYVHKCIMASQVSKFRRNTSYMAIMTCVMNVNMNMFSMCGMSNGTTAIISL
jgi:hypothetical protein